MNYFRRNQRLLSLEDAVWDRGAEDPDPAERLDLHAAIEALSDAEQAVVRLRFFEDLKLEEIAQVTDTNLNTVKSRLYKALKKLRDMTGEEVSDEPADGARQGAL